MIKTKIYIGYPMKIQNRIWHLLKNESAFTMIREKKMPVISPGCNIIVIDQIFKVKDYAYNPDTKEAIIVAHKM